MTAMTRGQRDSMMRHNVLVWTPMGCAKTRRSAARVARVTTVEAAGLVMQELKSGQIAASGGGDFAEGSVGTGGVAVAGGGDLLEPAAFVLGDLPMSRGLRAVWLAGHRCQVVASSLVRWPTGGVVVGLRVVQVASPCWLIAVGEHVDR